MLTEVDILCFTETWNAPRPFVRGYVPVTCTEQAERTAGGVAVYVKQQIPARDLQVPLTSQSHHGEYAAVELDDSGIVVMVMYLAPNLSNGDVKLFVFTACKDFDAKYRNRPFVLVGEFNVDIY